MDQGGQFAGNRRVTQQPFNGRSGFRRLCQSAVYRLWHTFLCRPLKIPATMMLHLHFTVPKRLPPPLSCNCNSGPAEPLQWVVPHLSSRPPHAAAQLSGISVRLVVAPACCRPPMKRSPSHLHSVGQATLVTQPRQVFLSSESRQVLHGVARCPSNKATVLLGCLTFFEEPLVVQHRQAIHEQQDPPAASHSSVEVPRRNSCTAACLAQTDLPFYAL